LRLLTAQLAKAWGVFCETQTSRRVGSAQAWGADHIFGELFDRYGEGREKEGREKADPVQG
jgi:hypothetical protein